MVKALQAADYAVLLAPATAATAVRSAAFDCRGADYATIVVTLGAEANTNSTNVTLQLAEGDTATGAWTTFNSAFNRVVDNTTAVVAVNHIDMKARKSHIRLTVTPDTHTTNGVVLSSAIGILDLEIKNASNASNGDNVVVG
jgi:hypothetical protein